MRYYRHTSHLSAVTHIPVMGTQSQLNYTNTGSSLDVQHVDQQSVQWETDMCPICINMNNSHNMASIHSDKCLSNILVMRMHNMENDYGNGERYTNTPKWLPGM